MVDVATFDDLARAASALSNTRGARFLAGGTLVMRALNEGDREITSIVRTTDPTFHRIQGQGERVVIGAGVTMSQILESRELDFLHPVARVIGGPAVRNMATIGGNLFAPSPYGELTTALLAAEATVALAGGYSAREVSVEDVIRDRAHVVPVDVDEFCRLAHAVIGDIKLFRADRDEVVRARKEFVGEGTHVPIAPRRFLAEQLDQFRFDATLDRVIDDEQVTLA